MVRGIDGLIAAIAERQHGVVSRTQLAALGLARWMAAVLAAGPGAVSAAGIPGAVVGRLLAGQAGRITVR